MSSHFRNVSGENKAPTIFSYSSNMSLKIIDTHQHLWDPGNINLPWLSGIPELNRRFSNEDYRLYTACQPGSNFDYTVEKTLYMEVDVAEECIQTEIDEALKMCRSRECPQVGLIASCRPGMKAFPRSLDFARSNPEIKGFRRVLHTDDTPPGYCLQREFILDMKRLGHASLPFDLCVRREELADVKRLSAACEQTQFVLDHCGNADARMDENEFDLWQRQMRSIAECTNVVCKVSGFVWTIQNEKWSAEADIEPILEVVFEAFGEERIVFGGDWPVCTLSRLTFQQWVDALVRFGRSCGPGTLEKMFQKNACAIYRL
ncbi:MAG: amidohydrolase family protein [Planctomycetota bacterium]|nr:amidohydrolase family protein [Planctomycetota bacterium]